MRDCAACVKVTSESLTYFLQNLTIAKTGVKTLRFSGLSKCGDKWEVHVTASLPLVGDISKSFFITFGGGVGVPLRIEFHSSVLESLLGPIEIPSPAFKGCCSVARTGSDSLADFIRWAFNANAGNEYGIFMTYMDIQSCDGDVLSVTVELYLQTLGIKLREQCSCRFSYYEYTLHITYELGNSAIHTIKKVISLFSERVLHELFTCVPIHTIGTEETYFDLIRPGERQEGDCPVEPKKKAESCAIM